MAGAVNNDAILKLRIPSELRDRVEKAAGGEGNVSQFVRDALEEKLGRRPGSRAPVPHQAPRL